MYEWIQSEVYLHMHNITVVSFSKLLDNFLAEFQYKFLGILSLYIIAFSDLLLLLYALVFIIPG